MTTATMPLDETKLDAFLGHALEDIGGVLTAALVMVGDELGLYKAMADGPVTASELARRTGTRERYIREWLAQQAASNYVTYDPATGAYTLPAEHLVALTDETSPAFVVGGFQGALGAVRSRARLADAFRSGEGIGWHEHDSQLFEGTCRFFGPSYRNFLAQSWIPACDGLVERLRQGARVADVGVGLGVSTALMAQAFPGSAVFGFDAHEESIEAARRRAASEGLGNVTFSVASAKEIPGPSYDLIATMDCLHDMGDPVGAARHFRSRIADDGYWLIVEPRAGDNVEENLNPLGRAYYGFSTLVCTPGSLSQEVGLGLGAQAGEARLHEVVTQGGFTRFRRVAESPINLVFEARP